MHRYEISRIIEYLMYHRREGTFGRGAPDTLLPEAQGCVPFG